MRCRECDVDLNENELHCPLCGGDAADDAPRIAGVGYQDYPRCRPVRAQAHAKPSLGARLTLGAASLCVAAGLWFRLESWSYSAWLTSGAAVLTACAALALLVDILLRREKAVRHVIYFVVFFALGAASLVCALAEFRDDFARVAVCACAAGVPALGLALTALFGGREFWEEMKARFRP